MNTVTDARGEARPESMVVVPKVAARAPGEPPLAVVRSMIWRTTRELGRLIGGFATAVILASEADRRDGLMTDATAHAAWLAVMGDTPKDGSG
jgi:hypothetical protein